MVVWSLQQRLFGLISRTCMAVYGRVPIFGELRGSAAIIRRGGRFLVIERSDGLGLAFPGGLASFRESDEHALAREVCEETGLRLTTHSLLFRYQVSVPYPCRISVYLAAVDGELRPSWEGIPLWVDLSDLQQRLMLTQRPILENGVLNRI